MKKTQIILLCAGILAFITAGISIVNPDVYQNFVDPDYIAESIGQDIITLIAAGFVIIISLCFKKASSRLRLTGLGLLIYLAYAYAIYAFGGVYNILFFNYIAILGLSVFGSFYLATDSLYKIREEEGNTKHRGKFAKTTAVFLSVTVILLGMIWITSAAEHITNHTKARETVIYVLDLSLILPLFAVSAITLFRRKTEGWYLGVVTMVKALTIGLSIVTGQLVKYFRGLEMDWFLVILFGTFTISALIINIIMKPEL